MTYDISLEYDFTAAPETVFDAFIDMYGPDRPDWILDSSLDLRVGGRWSVTFQPPGIDPFHEERSLTEVDRPDALGYRVAIGDDADTEVTVRLAFTKTEAGTHLRFSEAEFRIESQRDDFASAWPDVFAELAGRIPD